MDLSNRKITELETKDYSDRFLGGRGVASGIYREEVRPAVGAFDPENCLIFMTGPLGATGVQGASRFVVVGKSPMLLPERFCYGNLGGYFGPALKKAGYDGIAIKGSAGTPTSLWIRDGEAGLDDAANLWGKGTCEVKDALKKQYGKNVHFVVTGPAGERRCRAATLITDHEGSATAGFGAVMGSKHLKAIVVLGTGRVRVASPAELTHLNRLTLHMSKRGTLRIPLPRKQMERVGGAPCYQCGLDCLRGLFRTVSGREVVRKCQSMEFYMRWVLGRPGEPIDTAVDATEMCNDASLCTMETANIIRWLDRGRKSGYFTEKGTGLRLSEIGSRRFMEELLTMIVDRTGFGDTLAEGLLRAQRALGDGAPSPFFELTSGLGEEGAYSPRAYPVNALLYAFEPRQHMALLHDVSHMIARWLLHHIRPELSPTTAEVFREAATRFWGHPKAWDMTTCEGKAVAAKTIQDRTYVKDSLILCDLAWPIMDSFNTPDHVGDPTLESRILTAVTGRRTDQSELAVYGERIFNLQREILLCEGWQARKDDMPGEINFTVPIESDHLNPHLLVPGPAEDPVTVKGNLLDRDDYEHMRREFYKLRGWNPETGLQRTETLQRLGLGNLVERLRSRNLLSSEG